MNDKVKWGLVASLLVVGALSHYQYVALPVTQLLIGWVLLGLLVLGICSTTAAGKAFIGFSKESQIELRKVVWPTRKESVQTTFIVLVVVLIMAMLLWGMDSVFLRVVGVITG